MTGFITFLCMILVSQGTGTCPAREAPIWLDVMETPQETAPELFDMPEVRQETALELFDVVEVPREWTGSAGWLIGTRETWNIYPDRPAIRKAVEEWHPRSDSLNHLSADSSMMIFIRLLRGIPGNRSLHSEVEYEFILLDPHATGSGNTGFSATDSMDRNTRMLQDALVSLVGRQSGTARGFNLKEQLLSVWFHERWVLDPVTWEFTREVWSVTPVIWQRRRTGEGEAIDEPGTGYPVYFKNRLQPISLRNP